MRNWKQIDSGFEVESNGCRITVRRGVLGQTVFTVMNRPTYVSQSYSFEVEFRDQSIEQIDAMLNDVAKKHKPKKWTGHKYYYTCQTHPTCLLYTSPSPRDS